MDNTVLQTIKARRSCRAYTGELISDGQLQAILEAGQYAPYASEQAWHFTVVQQRPLLDRLNAAAKLVAGYTGLPDLVTLANNPAWDSLHGAGTLIIVSYDGSSPIPLDTDCAAANQNMLLAAESLGLGACWVYFILMAFEGPEGAALRAMCQVPAGFKLVCASIYGFRRGEAPAAAPRKAGTVTLIR